MLEKNERIYRVVSRLMLVVHVAMLVTLLVGGLFPYFEERNYYEMWGWSAWLLLLLPTGACVFACLAIEKPAFSLLSVLCWGIFLYMQIYAGVNFALVVIFEAYGKELVERTVGPSFKMFSNGVLCMLGADVVYGLYGLYTSELRKWKRKKEILYRE